MAIAQQNEHEVRVKFDGENLLVPIHEVDPKSVELQCNDHEGCYLVPDDGNPHNDLVKEYATEASSDFDLHHQEHTAEG